MGFPISPPRFSLTLIDRNIDYTRALEIAQWLQMKGLDFSFHSAHECLRLMVHGAFHVKPQGLKSEVKTLNLHPLSTF